MLAGHTQPARSAGRGDDAFSVWVYHHVLEELDPDRIYFTQADTATLAVFRRQLDNELNGNTWAFLPKLTQVYQSALERATSGHSAALADGTRTWILRGDYFKSFPKNWPRRCCRAKGTVAPHVSALTTFDRHLPELRRRNPAKMTRQLQQQDEKPVRQQVRK